MAADALRVDWSLDGGATFVVAWQIDGEDYHYLERTYPELGDLAVHLSSRSVVVHRTPRGHVVFVANGRDGPLFRDLEGTSHRLGSPDSGEGCCLCDPALPLGSGPLDRLGWYVAGGVVLAILGSAGSALRGRRRYGGLVLVVPLAVLAGYGAYLGRSFPPVGMFPGFIYGVPLILVALGAGVWLAVWFVRRMGRSQFEPASGEPSAGNSRGTAG